MPARHCCLLRTGLGQLRLVRLSLTRAYISSSYVRKESPILSLGWWGWGSCYESVVLGAPFTPAGITAEAERRGSALNLVQHYIVTSHAAGLNIA